MYRNEGIVYPCVDMAKRLTQGTTITYSLNLDGAVLEIGFESTSVFGL